MDVLKDIAFILLFFILLGGLMAVYRLCLHPLSQFPGPRAAAVSTRWLYAQSKAGHTELELERLHKEYGTHALRIAPNELHLTDVSLYKTVYSQSRPFPKYADFYEAFATPHTVFVETDAKLHKERRRMLNPFFSKAGIVGIERLLASHVKRLQKKLVALSKEDHTINAQNAFRCLTVDIITDCAFAESKMLIDNSDDSFDTEYLGVFDAAANVLWDSYFRPNIRRIGLSIPRAITSALSKELKALFALTDEAKACYSAYQTSPKRDLPAVFDGLETLDDELIASEAVDILVAGSDTTAYTLCVGLWHISRSPHIKQRLMAALKKALPGTSQDFPNMDELEKIPYLQACVQESIRVATAVPGRLPRVVPHGSPLVVDGKVIPPGTIVGMSAYTMHTSDKLWGPDARSFNPDRWLGEQGKSLHAHMVSFSKGLRSCIGRNLASAEITITMGMLYRTFDIELDVSCAEGFTAVDNFTQQIHGPGVLLRMRRIS